MARKMLLGTVIFGVVSLFLAISLSFPASAQTGPPPPTSWMTWSKFAGYNYGTGVDEDRRGNLIVSGYITPFPDMVLAKFGKTGRYKWVAFPGGATLELYDYGRATIATSDGGYLLAGTMAYYDSLGDINRAACLIKFSGSGAQKWQQLYKGFAVSGFNSVVENTQTGEYVAAGYCNDGTSQRILVARVAAGTGVLSGSYVDSRPENSASNAQCIRSISSGYIVAGLSIPPPPPLPEPQVSSIYLLKLDGTLTYVNQGFYGVSGLDSRGWSVVPANDGNGFVVAAGLGTSTPGGANFLFSLVRFNSSLSFIEYIDYGGGAYGEAKCIQSTGTGYVLAGNLPSSAHVIQVDGAGTLQWEWGYASAVANYVIQTKDGGFVVCGYGPGPTGTTQIFLAKLGGPTHGKK